MLALITKLMQDDSAQDLAEYGIALAVIGLVAGLAALAISRRRRHALVERPVDHHRCITHTFNGRSAAEGA